MAKAKREIRGLDGLEAAIGAVARPAPDPLEALQPATQPVVPPLVAEPALPSPPAIVNEVEVEPAPAPPAAKLTPVVPTQSLVVPSPTAATSVEEAVGQGSEVSTAAARPKAARQASRIGKVQIQFWTDEDVRLRLRMYALSRGTTLDALFNKAALAILRGDI